jgi:hypothetical protein
VVSSTPWKRPEVTVCVIGSSFRHVTVVPRSTVAFAGWNIRELRLITGPAGGEAPAGAEARVEGVVAADSALALQPASVPAAISNEALPMTSLRRTG